MADTTDVIGDIPRQITIKHDGNGITLRRLSLYDRAELLGSERKAQREKLKADLKEFGASAPDAIASLQDFDSVPVTGDDWVRFVEDRRNQIQILHKSLHGVVPADQVDAVARDAAVEWSDLVELCGLTLKVAEPEPAPGEGYDPNVLPPLSYGTPAATDQEASPPVATYGKTSA